MAKRTRGKKRKRVEVPATEKKAWGADMRIQHLVCIGLLLLLLLLFHWKIVFMGMTPAASDTMASRGAAQCMVEYRERTGKTPLWNSNLFSGMPGYMISVGNRVPSVKILLKPLILLLGWEVTFLLLAGIGMYLLLIRLKLDKASALIGAFSFVFTTGLLGMLEAGHNTKIRTVAYIPWAFLTVEYLFRKRTLFSFALVALTFSLQLRENHPQIVYYTWMMLGIYWLFQAYYLGKEGDRRAALVTGLLFVGAIVVSLAAVAQPYLSNYEYSKFTIRGGSGLSEGYATSWSFHPAEILTFLVPNFFGGVSPYYWGWMPFTSSSVYMGLIPLLLAVVGLVYNRTRTVWFMMIFSIVVLLLSFGRHLGPLSGLLLKVLPYYNRFRAPSMILIMLAFSVSVMGAYGVDFLLKRIMENREENRGKPGPEVLKRVLLYAILGLCGLLLLSFLIKDSLSSILPFLKDGDAQRYDAANLAGLKQQRVDLLFKDWIRMAIFAVAALGLILMAVRGRIGRNLLKVGLLGLVVVDLWTVDLRFFGNLEKPRQIDRQVFDENQTDRFLFGDTSLFRILPLPLGQQMFGNNRWAYHHQSIGGYHAAKLRNYQDIVEHCLPRGWNPDFRINMNIVNMLNAKYLVVPGRLPEGRLRPVNYDKTNGYITYLNPDALPRAFFADSLEVIGSREEVFRRLNSADFDPGRSAILARDPGSEIARAAHREVSVDEYDLQRIVLSAETDAPSLLVLSEIYYPAGWRAYVDDEEVEIHRANWILRSVFVPEGRHAIRFVFAPKTFTLGIWITALMEVLLFGALAVEGYRRVREGVGRGAL